MVLWIILEKFQILKVGNFVFGNIKHPGNVMDHGVFHTKTWMDPTIDPCPELCLVRGDCLRD